jgi:hypothetical protein
MIMRQWAVILCKARRKAEVLSAKLLSSAFRQLETKADEYATGYAVRIPHCRTERRNIGMGGATGIRKGTGRNKIHLSVD